MSWIAFSITVPFKVDNGNSLPKRWNTRLNGYLLEYLKTYAKTLYCEYENDKNAILPRNWRWAEIAEIAGMVCRGIAPKYSDVSDEVVLGQTCVRSNLILVENGRTHAPRKKTEKWLKNMICLLTQLVLAHSAEPHKYGLNLKTSG